MKKSDQEWREALTPEQYAVLRQKNTETPFSGEYETNYAPGIYSCAACNTQLFAAETKFDAECGWPSFYDALPGSVNFIQDNSLGMKRVEVTCTTCDSHLGHLFEGEKFPTPVDQRYCINSVSLKFTPRPN